MRFSIVIPARNEENYIERTVKSALDQDYPRKEFEVIVVDNDSNDNTAKVAEKAGADKVVKEPRRGTNIARQRGVDESKGEAIAFLDADCEPPRDWLARIENHLKKEGVAAVSGPYNYYDFKGWKKWAENLINKHLSVYLVNFLVFVFRKKAAIVYGGNFAAWRWAIQAIGGLPPLKFWGDDASIAMALSRRVGKVVFDPDLKVASSPRRLEEYGIIRMALIYAWQYLKVYFKKF